MAQSRTLYERLKDICDNVYYQPPETVKLKYPCIIFQLSELPTVRADNRPFLHRKRYTAIVIDRNAYSQIPARMIDEIEYCSYDRGYTADNLYHHALTIYTTDEPWLWSPYDLKYGAIPG